MDYSKKLRKILKPPYWPWIFAGAGLIGAALLGGVYGTADEAGLLRSGTLWEVLLLILSGAAVLLAAALCLDLKKAGRPGYHFPPSTPAAAGCLLGAVALLADAAGALFAGAGAVGLAYGLVGLVSAVALAYVALLRYRGRWPQVLMHGTVCMGLLLRLLYQYRFWCTKPQAMQFCFPLMANVLVLLACYQDATFSANAGSRRAHCITHLLAVYLCLCSLSGGENLPFYLGMAAWMATDLCRVTGRRKKRESAA